MELTLSKELAYSRKKKENEFVNFNTFRVQDNESGFIWQIIDFDSMFDLVRCRDKNVFSSTWLYTCTNDTKWRFGRVFENLSNTREALKSGVVPESILDIYEAHKESILSQFPEILEMQMFAFKKRRVKKFSEDGGELNIDRYMTGEPEIFEKRTIKNNKKTLRVTFNGAMLADATEVNFIRNMATASVLIDVFTGMGVAVEFTYCAISTEVTDSTDGVALSVLIKSANDPIDISRLLSCCAPGLFRSFVFSARRCITGGAFIGGVSTYNTPEFYRELKQIDVSLSAKDTTQQIIEVFTTCLKNIATN